MNNITFFTTFNKAGYELYGRAWIKTFINVASNNPNLYAKVYYEDFTPDIQHDRVEYLNFREVAPHHALWKVEYLSHAYTVHGPYTRSCAVRFSYKSFVMHHMLDTTESGFIVWLDGDCTFNPSDYSSFPSELTNGNFLTCQVEKFKNSHVCHVESGVLIFDCNNSNKQNFNTEFKRLYEPKNITKMPSDFVDSNIHGRLWEDHGPYDGFIIHKTIVNTGIPITDLNESIAPTDLPVGIPGTTFLNPEIASRFVHNIGHAGKNLYEQINKDLGIDDKFTWDFKDTDDMTYRNSILPDIVEIPQGYADKKFNFFMHNPVKDTIISQHLGKGDPWEPFISEVLLSHMKPGGKFLDIGANIGWHSKVLQEYGYDVISFEPHPLNFSLLEQNCKKDGSTLYNLALGNETKSSFIELDPLNYGNSFVVSEPNNNTSEIKIVRLDDVLSTDMAHNINAIKIDVQGFEPQVLHGGKNFFNALLPGTVIVIEVNPKKLTTAAKDIGKLIARARNAYAICYWTGNGRLSPSEAWEYALHKDNCEFDLVIEL